MAGPDIAMPDEEAREKPKAKQRSLAELLEAAASRPVLHLEEFAAYFGIGLATAYRLFASGAVPTIKIPGTSCIRVRREVVEQLAKKWENGGRKRRAGR